MYAKITWFNPYQIEMNEWINKYIWRNPSYQNNHII